MSKMISISEVSELTGVTIKTLKIWDNEKKLPCAFKTVGGHRRYNLDEVKAFIGVSLNSTYEDKKKVFVYCRVSTKKQQMSGNLERQKERLVNYCKEKHYHIVDVFEETASGLNDNRRELMKMFRRLQEVDSIIVECPDRLARFGYNYLIEYAKTQNVMIEPVEHLKRLEPNEEMVQDLISVVTCFSARLYGARGGKKIKNTINTLEKERGETLEDNNKSNAN
jgi:predicted site-specific integrase-resolvase